ncbi:MAG: hypothetical protein AAFN93_03890 [Bacteroidota bacterium]
MSNKGQINYFLTLLVTILLLVVSFNLQAQDEEKPTIPLDHFYAKPINNNGFRKILSKLHFTFETGYGRTFYNQDLSDFNLLQQQDSLPLIFGKDLNITGGNVTTGYNYFLNEVNTTENTSFGGNDFLINSDTTDLGFKGRGTSIPLTLMIHVEFDRYQIGGGATFEYHSIGTFNPTSFSDQISSYDPNFNSTFYKKYFVTLGAKVYRYREYVLAADARIGAFNLSNRFDRSVIQKGVFVNIGATLRRELSEYFSVFARPSFDFKNFTVNLPESSLSVNTSMNAFYIGIGATYRIPELKRCFIKSCGVQVNHQHGNMEYRSRKHPFYKKQNPHHGENYPRLIKYKRKNRKKLNPY